MNAPEKIAAPVINIHDAADKLFRESAISDLTWRLKDGKSVGGFYLDEIFYAELDNNPSIARDVFSILTNYDDRHLLTDRLVDGMIERFLSTPKGLEAIEEEMERQDKYEPDPGDWQEA